MIKWPISFRWGTLSCNYHGRNNSTLRNQWHKVRITRGWRFYRYFMCGDCVFFDFQLRRY